MVQGSSRWNSGSCFRELPYICQAKISKKKISRLKISSLHFGQLFFDLIKKQERIIGNKLTDSTFEALMTCHDWIHQSMTCRKPFAKISKYEFRFTKVAKGTFIIKLINMWQNFICETSFFGP